MKFVFGEHVLDQDRRELTRGSEVIAVGPQVFDLLVHLVRSRERVVTKDDLIEVVWGGRIVSESTLTSHINAVRKAVGDSGGEQRLVRTIARKGYRFVGDVRESEASERAEPAMRLEASAQALALPDRPSIAVLPFLNLSGDPQQEYFSDGITEDVITALSRVKWFFVIARNSSFTYKGRAVDEKQVARELGVRYVLEGSVRKAGDRVRIRGELIQGDTGRHIWTDRFDGDLADISPTLANGSRSSVPKTSRTSRMLFARRDCRSDRQLICPLLTYGVQTAIRGRALSLSARECRRFLSVIGP